MLPPHEVAASVFRSRVLNEMAKKSCRRHRAIAAASIGAFAGVAVDQQSIAAPVDTPASSTHAGAHAPGATRNDIGCVESHVPFNFPPGGPEGWSNYFHRPSNLDVGKLSDEELRGCGLLPRGTAKEGTKRYEDWLRTVTSEMKSPQPSPWEDRPRMLKYKQGWPAGYRITRGGF